jgi:hypothetical protein
MSFDTQIFIYPLIRSKSNWLSDTASNAVSFSFTQSIATIRSRTETEGYSRSHSEDKTKSWSLFGFYGESKHSESRNEYSRSAQYTNSRQE